MKSPAITGKNVKSTHLKDGYYHLQIKFHTIQT